MMRLLRKIGTNVRTRRVEGPVVGGLRDVVAAIGEALDHAMEPHDNATREAATKALHALGFALEDVRRLR
jgi:hypothetical protein